MSAGQDPLARIQADASAALKAGDKDRLRVLRMLVSDLKKAAIDASPPNDALSPDESLAVLRRAVKSRADSVEQYEKAGRKDLADRERAEIAVVEGYLPRAPSEADVRAAAAAPDAAQQPARMKFMGAVMKDTLARVGPGADGKLVSRVVADLLKG